MYQEYLKIIDDRAADFCGISDFLWDNAELPYGEYNAVEHITGYLRKEGFTITNNVANIPTAFTATFGSGKPHLGVLAEYDALAGLSQAADVTEATERPGSTVGHGCGHNLFAGGSVAAVTAIKAYIEKTGKGSITLFGCPAEEGGAGKVFMVREGVFKGIDAIVSWHPEKMYMVRTRPSLANVRVTYSFKGIAAHAGGSPHLGRSALDAVELMNVGCNFLREHMPLSARVHYAIVDAGGEAPNLVQSHAAVVYMIRDSDAESVQALKARVDKIAQGAALMTETTMESEVTSGYSNLITIPTLQATANESMQSIPVPVPTEEELAFGKALQATMILTNEQKNMPTFADHVLEPAPPTPHGGSTDTADVSWNCPTVQMHIGNWVVGTPGHSWQSTVQSRGTYAKRAMLYAGKAVAGTIMRLLDRPETLAQAQREHAEKTVAGYVCPLPAGLMPEILPKPEA